MTIDPGLAERLRAELRHRAESWAETDARHREAFGDAWGPPDDGPPFAVDLEDLSPDELALLTVDVLWPPSKEERERRAAELFEKVFGRTAPDQQ
jgi:hypothetical protein